MKEEYEKEEHMARSQEYFREIVNRYVSRLDTKIKIIVGHFFVESSKIGIIPYPDQLPHEFIFKKDMLPLDQVDLAVFGHIHTPQTLCDDKVLIPGSLERVDFGEINEDKGFYIFDTTQDSLKFISNNPRKLVKLHIEVPEEIENPTDYILKSLQQKNLKGAMVRVIIRIPSLLKEQVIQRRIYPYLEEVTFHSEIIWDTSEKRKEIILSEFVLDPIVLFSNYISEKYQDYPYVEKLKAKGLEILENALSKVEEEK